MREIRIHENGTDSLGRDYKRLTLHFRGATQPNLEIGIDRGTNLNNEQLKVIADMMEDEISKYQDNNCIYNEMISFINHKMDEVKQRNQREKKTKQTSW